MGHLNGKTALITGASSGIGAHFAQLLARHGARVALAARRVERLTETKAQIEAQGGTARIYGFDATGRDAPDALFDSLQADGFAPSILINAAGVSRPGRAERNTMDDFDETVGVNLRTPWRLAQLCAAHWIKTGEEGSIVNVSSMLARRVGPGVSIYCMTKAALSHLTAAQAREWAQYGIRVNALSPGYIETEINEGFWETPAGRQELDRLPRKRLGKPRDLDSAILFLTDPASGFVNGADIVVDDAQSWAI